MMKAMVAGLLAAAALLPGVALAQEGGIGGAMRARMQARVEQARAQQARSERPRGDWQRADRPQRLNRPDRPRPDRPEQVARPDRPQNAQRPDRPQQAGGWQRPDRPRPEGGWQRPDRPQQVRPGTARPDRPAQGGWQRGNRRDWNARDPRQGLLWQDRNRDGRWDTRRDWDRDRRDWNDRRDRDDRRSWNARGGRGWDRDWRRDARYDWNRYRAMNRQAYRLPRYYAPYGWNQGYRRFGIGATLATVLFAQSYWIGDPWSYRLPDADGPYRWVRYYDDALLVDTYTGEVVDVVEGIFW